MTSIETYRRAYNRMVEMNDETVKNREGSFISFEEYLEYARRRIEGQRITHLGGRRFSTRRNRR